MYSMLIFNPFLVFSKDLRGSREVSTIYCFETMNQRHERTRTWNLWYAWFTGTLKNPYFLGGTHTRYKRWNPYHENHENQCDVGTLFLVHFKIVFQVQNPWNPTRLEPNSQVQNENPKGKNYNTNYTLSLISS